MKDSAHVLARIYDTIEYRGLAMQTVDELARHEVPISTDDISQAVRGVDFIYTDVWASMSEAPLAWEEWIQLLKPFLVNQQFLDATGNPHI